MSFNTKESFRKLCINRLKFFSKRSKIKKDKLICSQILDIIDLYRSKNILLYLPLQMEVDVRPLIELLRKREGVQVFVPLISGDSFKAVKYRLPLKKGKMGIKEPNNSSLKYKLDMVIVPIVGIDRTSARVGFGAGMYDRFYERLGYRPITVFTQRKLCISKEIITSSHDIKPDYIVSM